MERFLTKILRHVKDGEQIELVEITGAKGSTPRGVGARMAVWADGRTEGTIGGGNVEYQAGLKAKELVCGGEHEPIYEDYNLGPREMGNLGMVCGGNITVEFRYVDGQNAQMVEAFADFVDKNREEAAVRVYVFGAGHVSQQLVPVLAHVGFDCMVLDDREEFANRDCFPQAEEVRICDFKHLEETADITETDYVVIMTRGHEWDYVAQSYALRRKPHYIGVMGSRHKIAFVTKRLLEDGFSLEEIQSCHMPIGTEIQAETPEEIAISIAGELIQTRARARKSGKKAQ